MINLFLMNEQQSDVFEDSQELDLDVSTFA